MNAQTLMMAMPTRVVAVTDRGINRPRSPLRRSLGVLPDGGAGTLWLPTARMFDGFDRADGKAALCSWQTDRDDVREAVSLAEAEVCDDGLEAGWSLACFADFSATARFCGENSVLVDPDRLLVCSDGRVGLCAL